MVSRKITNGVAKIHLGLSNKIILVLGIANVIADGFSMGISSYLAEKARKVSKNSYMVGLVTFLSFVIIGLIPILPYIINLFYEDKEDKDDHKEEKTAKESHRGLSQNKKPSRGTLWEF